MTEQPHLTQSDLDAALRLALLSETPATLAGEIRTALAAEAARVARPARRSFRWMLWPAPVGFAVVGCLALIAMRSRTAPPERTVKVITSRPTPNPVKRDIVRNVALAPQPVLTPVRALPVRWITGPAPVDPVPAAIWREEPDPAPNPSPTRWAMAPQRVVINDTQRNEKTVVEVRGDLEGRRQVTCEVSPVFEPFQEEKLHESHPVSDRSTDGLRSLGARPNPQQHAA